MTTAVIPLAWMNNRVSVLGGLGRSAPEHATRAALDLISRIPVRAPRRIADVYRGRGSMRALLARRFPDADIEAFELSRSIDDLAEALNRPHQDANGPRPGASHKFDLICSSGSPEMAPSLPRLLPILLGMVAARGWLAVQYPNDLYEPRRALMRMIAADGPWAKTLLPIAKTRTHSTKRPVRSPQPDLRRCRTWRPRRLRPTRRP